MGEHQANSRMRFRLFKERSMPATSWSHGLDDRQCGDDDMTAKSSKHETTNRRWCMPFLATVLIVLGFGSTARAQTFNSGSDGSDGALSLTQGTYTFDPNDVATF